MGHCILVYTILVPFPPSQLMIRTCENEATPASDQLLKDTILEGGWIASDCESLLGDGENENRNNLRPEVEPELESPPAPLHEPHPPNNEDAVPEEHVPEAEEMVDDVNPPVVEPHVNTEGHRNICSILLPQLFWVMKDPRYAGRSPRDQVREACDRHMATVQVYMFWLDKGSHFNSNTVYLNVNYFFLR